MVFRKWFVCDSCAVVQAGIMLVIIDSCVSNVELFVVVVLSCCLRCYFCASGGGILSCLLYMLVVDDDVLASVLSTECSPTQDQE
jgi:hypothetical protein